MAIGPQHQHAARDSDRAPLSRCRILLNRVGADKRFGWRQICGLLLAGRAKLIIPSAPFLATWLGGNTHHHEHPVAYSSTDENHAEDAIHMDVSVTWNVQTS